MDKKASVSEKRGSKNRSIKNLSKHGVHIGRYIFKFQNGDVYAGGFKATKTEELCRQGPGKHFCEDGSIYEGIWNNDNLEEASNLIFPNNDVYQGLLQNFHFSGNSYYNVAQVGVINAVFDNNYPTGDIVLTDPHGFKWKGIATKESSETILYPVNHFKIRFEDEVISTEEEEEGEDN